jgi:hypothetical protein
MSVENSTESSSFFSGKALNPFGMMAVVPDVLKKATKKKNGYSPFSMTAEP